MNHNNYIVIMAGGVGSRFWPASREHLPKQFLDITGSGSSLIQMTFMRAAMMVPKENIFISSNKKYKSLIQEQLPEISENQLLLEPSRNNTAPCIAYAALKLHSLNPNAVFGVLPSDHVIGLEQVFVDKMNKAFAFAANHEAIVTLGIEPTRPDTGYGYIEVGSRIDNDIRKVNSFKEKPNADLAKQYLAQGNYVWNGGIFIWSTKTVLGAFNQNAKQIIDVLSEDVTKYNTAEEQAYVDQVYPQTEKISVDYALLEKSEQVYTIPADIDWSDLGTWASLHSFLEKDPADNVILSGEQIIKESNNCLVKTKKDKLVVINGIEDFIIIDEDDVLLIYPKSKEQEIKALRSSIKSDRFL